MGKACIDAIIASIKIQPEKGQSQNTKSIQALLH